MVWTVLNDSDDKTILPNYLKDLYSREPQQVDSLLSTLINPKDSKNKLDVEKCLWVICGGQNPDDFTRIIKANDRSVICGLVWDANFIAYRCKTCGITPCMSLCAECFENGDHDGHDFNMFKSGAGGACDCGDVEVMKPCGFCSRHGPKSAKSYRTISEDVTLMVNLVVPKLLDFLLIKLEDATHDKHSKVDRGDDEVARLLLQLCEMGDITRKIVAQNMLHVRKNSLLESKLVFKSDQSLPPYVVRRQSSTESSQPPESGIQNLSDGEGPRIQSVADSILSLPGPSKDCDISYVGHEEENKSVLETLLDLLIELKFPQYLVTLVLSMLQETDYKQEFMKIFCCRYAKIANLLTHRFEHDEDQKLSNRLVHASVQLFSNENLTFKMVQNNNLLSIIVSALSDLISRTLIKVDHDAEDNVNSKSLFVVNCNHEIIQHHRYWPVVSDFHNLLSHGKIARHFLGEAALIRRWMGILTHFTGMNKNLRQLIVHIPYESVTYQYAYSTEIETSSHIMTNLLSVCSSAAESDFIRLVLSECIRALRSWFRMIQVQIVKPFLKPLNGEEFTSTGPIPRHEITFHLPLHRYLAGFISQAINYCGMNLEEVLPCEEVLWCVMEHVLRIQVGIGEILSGLWVRNGYMLRSQEEFYLQGQYCNQCVDLDIFLLQVCVMALDSDQFLTTLIQRYKLETWFTFGRLAASTQPADTDVQQAMVESMLNLILQLVYQRMYMGLSEERMVHLEVVTKLTMGDFTHSQLTDNLPEKPGISELTDLFDEVLSRVSDYKQPTNESGQLTQGIYALKPDLWKSEFQPLHVMLRGSYKRGYQLAMDKYKGWYQAQNKTKVQGLWPPFRTPLELNPQFKSLYRILHSRTLHAMLFTVLYKAVQDSDSVSDNMIYLTFYLIDLCIAAPGEVQTPTLERGSLKPDITVAELEDGTVPHAIVKCILFLQQHRHLPTLYKVPGKTVEQRVQELCRKLISSPHTLLIKPDQYTLQDVTEAVLLMCNTRLQPPLLSRLYSAAKQLAVTTGVGTAMFDKKTHMYHIQQVLEQLPPHRYKLINMLMYYLSTLVKEELATLDQICAVYVPEGVETTTFSSIVSCYDWMFRVRQRPAETLESIFEIKYLSDKIEINSYQCIMGTSLIQCMYEIRKKLAAIDFSQSPKSSNTYTSHNGVESITRILDTLCERDANNTKLVRSLERADATTPEHGVSPTSSSEAKRKRAKERQAKLLKQFASKQRIFEAHMESGDLIQDEEEPSSKATYPCIICGEDSVNTEMKPVGTLVYCQPASLLLHSTDPDTERAIMNDKFEEIPTLYSTLSDHYTTLKSLYSSTSVWQSVGQRAKPGTHLQSCSHYLHIDCYKTYSESQRTGNSDPIHNPHKDKELSCPTCRRLSNTVLPISPEPFFKAYSPVELKVAVSAATQIPLPFTHSCIDKAYLSSHPPSCLGCSATKLSQKIKQVMHKAPIDLVTATIIKSTTTPYYTAIEQFVTSLEDYYNKYVDQKRLERLSRQDTAIVTLHCTLQCELIERNNSVVTHQDCDRKYCTGRLIGVLATQSDLLIESISINEPLLKLIRLIHTTPGASDTPSLTTADVPLVLMEPSWMLLKFVLFSKLQTDWENFVTVVRLLMSLQFLRSLLSVAAKFAQDEQLAWTHKAAADCDDFQALLGVVCGELSRLSVHATVGEMDITSYVWSIQSIESNLQTLCLPLLREAVLLGHHMYDKPLPDLPLGACEFTNLSSWLGLLPNANQPTSVLKVVNIPRDKLLGVCRDLVRQLPLPSNITNSPLTGPLMPLVKSWGRPRLLTLPRLYGKLYLHYRHVQCKVCQQVPHDPALCLVCGQLVCVRSLCCQWLNTGECTKHAQQCGAGTAIYLVIMSSTVVIIRGERVYLWGSVYLDQHDEEDIDLKRGKPLYLSERRYKCLNQQWISHSFDHFLKRWGWHQQQF